MALTVRIDINAKDAAVTDIQKKAEDAWSYISNELQNIVTNFSKWWIGDAYESFKQDFETTKQKFYEDIYEEIKNKYDVIYKEIEISGANQLNKIILVSLIVSLILNVINFIALMSIR